MDSSNCKKDDTLHNEPNDVKLLLNGQEIPIPVKEEATIDKDEEAEFKSAHNSMVEDPVKVEREEKTITFDIGKITTPELRCEPLTPTKDPNKRKSCSNTPQGNSNTPKKSSCV
jgi:hypothetical protein